MGSIYLNGIRYGGLSGPPEGDQVYVNPIVNQGIKIAEITVNDTTDSLYAPGGVTDVEVDGTSVVSQQGIAEIDLSSKQDALTAGTNISIDSTTNTISATDTTYNVFTTGNNGLVPAPTSSDSTKVLQGDGTWVPQTGGTDVEANPSAAATDTLNKIGIDGTVYGISGGGGSGNVDDVYVNGESVLDANHIAQIKSYKEVTQSQYDALPSSKTSDGILYAITDAGGGSGTTVIANPSGTATDDITKIQIGNTIYEIPSGGSGGSVEIKEILDNSAGASPTTYELTESVYDFDFIIIVGVYNFGGNQVTCSNIIPSDYLTIRQDGMANWHYIQLQCWEHMTYFGMNNPSASGGSGDKIDYISDTGSRGIIRNVYGINCGSGGGSWTDVTGTLIAGQTTLTLTDSAITTDSTLDFYTDIFGVNPTDITVTTGSVTLTFEAQANDIEVKVRVSA